MIEIRTLLVLAAATDSMIAAILWAGVIVMCVRAVYWMSQQ